MLKLLGLRWAFGHASSKQGISAKKIQIFLGSCRCFARRRNQFTLASRTLACLFKFFFRRTDVGFVFTLKLFRSIKMSVYF